MPQTYRPPSSSRELPLSVAVGVGFAGLLFLAMALAQMMGDVEPPSRRLDETLIAFNAPEIQEFEEEEPPPPEEEEPPPELEKEPPMLSLAQLDIALNPGTGGSLAGDFSMPTIGSSSRDLGTEDFVDFSDLDQVPRPVGVVGLNFPRSLRRRPISGRIVLFIQLDSSGEVLDVKVEDSDLPDAHNNFVRGQVSEWRFTPPTRQGVPVKAQARLPMPIKIGA